MNHITWYIYIYHSDNLIFIINNSCEENGNTNNNDTEKNIVRIMTITMTINSNMVVIWCIAMMVVVWCIVRIKKNSCHSDKNAM